MTAKKRAATRSAAEAALVGWPLPAAVVARIDSTLRRVATSCSARMSSSEISAMDNLDLPANRFAITAPAAAGIDGTDLAYAGAIPPLGPAAPEPRARANFPPAVGDCYNPPTDEAAPRCLPVPGGAGRWPGGRGPRNDHARRPQLRRAGARGGDAQRPPRGVAGRPPGATARRFPRDHAHAQLGANPR